MKFEWLQRTFDDPTPLVSDEAFARVEQELGVVFPEDYRAVIREHQGAMPLPGSINQGKNSTAIEYFLHFEKEPFLESLSGVYSYYPMFQELPSGIIPFAAGLGSDYFCFDFRVDPKKPTVLVLLHGGSDGMVHLADSFTSVLEILIDEF